MAQRGSRQKRKRKKRSPQGLGPERKQRPWQGSGAEGRQPSRQASGAEAMARGYARARQKDEEARAGLVPLEPGERPVAVTVGAVVAAVGGLSNLVGLVVGFGQPGPLVVGTLIAWLVAVGMWRTRYWAVLGMQTILGFIIVGASLALLFATSVGYALLAVAIVGSAGTLFWFLVKAMARIQMPERPRASRHQ
ncbi:MAG TPA: hypothetical protein VKB17_02755 [Thermoleophilaceae bacterium]|nr:hypothetical protein [Thermoleophilaceae bacterium]